MVNEPRLILGSGSPRRLDLLAQLGVRPNDIRPPDIDETPRQGELPRPYCVRMARAKVRAVPAADDDIVLCADTTVALGRRPELVNWVKPSPPLRKKSLAVTE